MLSGNYQPSTGSWSSLFNPLNFFFLRLKTSISMVSKMKRGVKAERKSHLKDVQALIDCFYQKDYTLSEKLNILQDLFKKKSQDSSSDLSK